MELAEMLRVSKDNTERIARVEGELRLMESSLDKVSEEALEIKVNEYELLRSLEQQHHWDLLKQPLGLFSTMENRHIQNVLVIQRIEAAITLSNKLKSTL